MALTPPPPAPHARNLAAGITDVARADEDIRGQFRALALDMLAAARQILDHGTPRARESLIRGVVPAVIRDSLEERHEDEGIKALRERQDRLAAAVKEGIATGAPEPEPVADAPMDTPGA